MSSTAALRGGRVGIIVSWVVVLGIAVALLIAATANQIGGGVPAADTAADLQVKLAVAMDDPDVTAATREELLGGEGAAPLRGVTLVAEGLGTEQAREALQSVSEDRPAELRGISAILERLYGGDDEQWRETADTLPAEDRAALVRSLGWSGRLAVNPPGADTEARARIESDARGALILLSLAGVGGVGGCGLGVFAWAWVVARLSSGRARLVFEPAGSAGDATSTDPSTHAAPWMETFAIWLVLFVGLKEGVELLPLELPPMLGAGVIMLGSLIALGWLRVRGVTWSAARHHLGLHAGSGWLREVGAGLVGYLGMLPLLGIGILLMLALTTLIQATTGAEPGGAHPVMAGIGEADPLQLALIYVLAAVIAPIVEETTFRGLLYGHLRQISNGWGRGLSMLAAGLSSGLVFAIVHPQGIAAVPVLALMGFAFCLVREWRDSLIAPMVMHGVSNGLMITLASRLFA